MAKVDAQRWPEIQVVSSILVDTAQPTIDLPQRGGSNLILRSNKEAQIPPKVEFAFPQPNNQIIEAQALPRKDPNPSQSNENPNKTYGHSNLETTTEKLENNMAQAGMIMPNSVGRDIKISA